MPSPYLMREGALEHTVPGDLTHVAGAELEDLGCNGVLFHQRLLWKSRARRLLPRLTGDHVGPAATG